MTPPFLANLDEFAARFCACEMTRAEWTHEAHLAMGAWHVDRYGAEEALIRLRTGIRSLNESFGNKNTAADGYHETITAAYVRLIGDFLGQCPANLSIEERASLLLESPLARRDALLMYYSEGRLMSAHARARWVEPDLLPLPSPPISAPKLSS
jgi:hypothetical protein